VAITLIPALLIIWGHGRSNPAQKARVKKTGFDFDTRLAAALYAVAQKKGLVLKVTALVFALSVLGASKVVADNAMVEFFNENAEVSRSDRFIREHFGGSTQLLLSVEADAPQTMLSPDTLIALDDLSTYLTECVPRVTKVMGFTDMIKRINQLFNADESPDLEGSVELPAFRGAGNEAHATLWRRPSQKGDSTLREAVRAFR
jgi:predicted RND superfamily exporter protein